MTDVSVSGALASETELNAIAAAVLESTTDGVIVRRVSVSTDHGRARCG